MQNKNSTIFTNNKDILGNNNSIGLFGKSLDEIKNKIYDIQSLGLKQAIFDTSKIDISAIKEYNSEIQKGTSYQEAMALASKNTNKETVALMESAKGATVTNKELTAAAKAQSVAFKAVSMAGNMLVMALVTKGIELAANAIDHYVNRAKYAAEAMEEAQQKISDAQSKLQEVTSTVSDNKDRFLELAQGVDQFSNNVSLSTEDYQEYLDISNKLADLAPSLVAGYDDQGNALLSIGSNAEDTSQKLQEIIDQQQAIAKQTLVDNLPDIAEGVYNEVQSTNTEIADLQSQLDDLENQSKNLNVDIKGAHGKITFKDDDYTEYGKAMEKALESAGIEYEKVFSSGLYETSIQLKSASEDQLKQAQTYYDTWLQEENDYNQTSINGLQKSIAEKEALINQSYSKISANLQEWTKQTPEYTGLSQGYEDIVDKLIPQINWSSMENAPVNDSDYTQYIQDQILKPLMSIPAEHKAEINSMFQQLLSFDEGDLNVLDFAKQLQAKLDEYGIKIDLTPVIANEQEAKEKITASIERLSNINADFDNEKEQLKAKSDYKLLSDYTKDFNETQIEAWNSATLGSQNANQAILAYEEAIRSTVQATEEIEPPTFSDTVLSLKDLKDQLSDLDTIMASFVSGDDIDVSSFNNIINKFTELKEAGKDIDMSSVEDAINQIGNSSSIEEAQSSLDSLCQQYINASGILDNLTESNAGFVQSQLEQIGVSNAAEIVTNSLAAEQDYLAWAKDNSAASSANLANMTSVEMAALLADANVTDEAKASMYNYWIAKGNVLDLGAITTDGDISNLSGLCSALGIATKQCETFAKAKSLLAAAVQSNDLTAIAGYAGQIAGLQASITTQISATLGSKSNSNYSPKYGGGSSTKKAYEDAAKDAKKSADKAKDDAEKAAEEARQKAEAELDAYLKYQEAMLDANEITVSQYADAVSDRLTEMFENGEISASKFYSGVETMCKKQLDIYDKVKEAVVRRYDKEIDKIQETMDAIDEQNEALNKQKDIMDKQLQYVKAMEEVEIDKLNKEKEAYEKENEAYEKQKDTMDKAVSYATTLIQKKIEKINDESDALDKLSEKYDQQQTDYQNMLSGINKVYDDRIDELNKQSDAIQDQIDKIQDENSELDLQYRKEQALYALSKAQNQRTKKLYVKGRGIIYTQDDEAIRDAKKDLKDIETEEVVSKLNKEKEAIADQIEEVQKWKDKWSEISNAYQEKINNELLVNHFGTDYVNKILSGNISDYNDFKNAYLNIQAKIDDMSEQKKALEEELDAWNQKKDAWSKVTDAAQNEENKQAAIQQWGKNYAKIILDARQSDLQNFETNYLFINDRINDNQGAIDSLDEIINIHEQRKQSYEDLTTAMENEELKRELNRELSRTWEQDTLNASELDWEAWKNKYLAIQDQLNNNDKLKESYDEKKAELETWRDKWSDATSSIQNSINDQYAAQILGQNWESTIFTNREKNLKTFTNAYVSLYQKQADAAINAANAEVTAAKNARAEIASSSTSVDNGSSTGSSSYSTGGGGSTGGRGGSSTPKPKERSDKYWTFQYFGGGYSSEAAAKKHMGDYAGANGTTKYGSQYFVVKWLQGCETSAIAANYVKSLRATAKKNKYNYVKRFHSGLELGRISKTNGEDFNTVQRVGTQGLKSDEVPIIAQAGEAVVTEKQIENLAEAIDYIPVYQEILDKISEVANAGKMDEVAKMIPKAKYDTPKPKEVTQNNQTINVTQDINVNCPNVTNTTGAEYLVKALRKASADVLVYNK